jgi:hypothetical protein
VLPDRESRDRLIGAIRALLSGTITAAEFESRIPARSSDPGIRALLSDSAWQLYAGQARQELADRDRGIVSRWMLFLRTDKPYEWPVPTRRQSIALALGAVMTFGLSAWYFRRYATSRGDIAVWPFLHRGDFDQAMRSPTLLQGRA